jgi:hypothetical protein
MKVIAPYIIIFKSVVGQKGEAYVSNEGRDVLHPLEDLSGLFGFCVVFFSHQRSLLTFTCFFAEMRIVIHVNSSNL